MNDPMASNPYQSPISEPGGAAPPLGKTYGGIRRLRYFGYTFLAGIVYQFVALGIVTMLDGTGGGQSRVMTLGAILPLVLLYVGALLYIAYQRLINIGSNPWWCLGLLVPFLNMFVGIRCLICPEGYDDHKTLDTPAKIVLWLAIGMIVLSVLLVFITLGVA